MNSTPPTAETLGSFLRESLVSSRFVRAIFSGPQRGPCPGPWIRVTVRAVPIKGERSLQYTFFDGRKTLVKNRPPVEGPPSEILDAGFSSIHLTLEGEEIDLRQTRKGKIFMGRKAVAPPAEVSRTHNRVKDVPLPEGRAHRLLQAMGITTRDGRVRPSMRDKYTQINEFLKHLSHLFEDAGLESLGREVRILDCGCGASYLTLAVHYYLNEVRGVPAHILGVDVNEEVIRKSMSRASRLGSEGVSFVCKSIGELPVQADVVLALHACDTATDEALGQAVRAGARLILSVPCCHHALNAQVRAEGQASVLRPLMRHGILRERMADLATDAFRALALRIVGYRTDVVEFVSAEHTARNLMIRAVRGAPGVDPALVAEYRALKDFLGVTPAIEAYLGAALGVPMVT